MASRVVYGDTVGGGLIQTTIDEKSYVRAMKRLEKYADKKFTKRMEAAFLSGARLAVKPMRAAAPKRSKLLSKKVTTRKYRPPSGYFVYVGTKSRAPHSYLVSRGHYITSHSGARSGARATANPYVENTIRSMEPRIIKFIEQATTDEGISALGAFGGF